MANYQSNSIGQILPNIKTIRTYGNKITNAKNKLFNTFSLSKEPRKVTHPKKNKLPLLNIIT